MGRRGNGVRERLGRGVVVGAYLLPLLVALAASTLGGSLGTRHGSATVILERE